MIPNEKDLNDAIDIIYNIRKDNFAGDTSDFWKKVWSYLFDVEMKLKLRLLDMPETKLKLFEAAIKDNEEFDGLSYHQAKLQAERDADEVEDNPFDYRDGEI